VTKTETYTSGAVKSTLLNVVAKGIGFLNTLVITFYFGAQVQTDIYYYLIAATALVCSTINGIDLFVLVPESIRKREQESIIASQKFLNFFLYVYTFIGIALGLIAYFSPVLFFSTLSKFELAALQANADLLVLAAPFILFQLVNNLLANILTSNKYFTAAIFAGLINSGLSILLTILLHNTWGIKGALVGFLIGYITNFFVLVFTLRKKLNWQFFKVEMPKRKKVWENILLIQLNILPVWLRSYIILKGLTALTSQNNGVYTSVNIALTLSVIPEVFLLNQIVSVAGIKFSELFAQNSKAELKKLVINIFKILLHIILPIAIIMALCSKEIVQLFFLRGNFNSSNVQVVAYCLFCFALILPTKISDALFSRLFTSFQEFRISIFFAVIGHFIFTALCYFLIKYYQLNGYMIALAIGGYIVMPLAVYLTMHYAFPFYKSKDYLKNILKAVLLFFTVYALNYFLYQQIQSINFILIILIISVSVIISFTLPLYFWTKSNFVDGWLHKIQLLNRKKVS
jgi:putative peptidoglycan lipid II flippase